MEAQAFVPKETVATWLPNEPLVGAVGYSGYCAHPPIQQQTVVAPLSEEEELELQGKELVGLQIVFRHGARIPASPLKQCFNVPNYSIEFDCGIQESLRWDTEDKRKLRLKMQYPRATGRCGTGRLQDEAKGQFRHVAETLKRHYDFDKIGITSDSTVLRADEVPRTQASMFLLVSELFPHAREMELNVLPKDLDAWSGTPPCRNMLNAHKAMEEAVDLPIVPRPTDANNFAQAYIDATGTILKPVSAKDCLMQAVCTPAALPAGFTQEIFHWAMNKSIEAQRQKYLKNPEISTVLAAPVLWDIQDRLLSQVNDRAPALALYATHEGVLVALLVAMGLWDGEAPTYAEALVVEAWQETSALGEQKGFFRFLRRGKAIAVPGCQGKTVCPIEVFQSLGKPWLRDPSQMALYCGGLDPQPSVVQEEMLLSSRTEMDPGQSAHEKQTMLKPSLLLLSVALSSFSAIVGAFLFQIWKAKRKVSLAAPSDQGYVYLLA